MRGSLHHHRHHAVVLTKLIFFLDTFAGSRGRGTSSSWTCAELGGVIRSVLDRSDLEVRLHQPRCQTLPLLVYEGTWTHSPPLVAMHLLDRSCVSVGFFSKLHAMFPNNPWPKPHPLLIVLAFLWTQCDLESLNQKCRVLLLCQSLPLAFSRGPHSLVLAMPLLNLSEI